MFCVFNTISVISLLKPFKHLPCLLGLDSPSAVLYSNRLLPLVVVSTHIDKWGFHVWFPWQEMLLSVYYCASTCHLEDCLIKYGIISKWISFPLFPSGSLHLLRFFLSLVFCFLPDLTSVYFFCFLPHLSIFFLLYHKWTMKIGWNSTFK